MLLFSSFFFALFFIKTKNDNSQESKIEWEKIQIPHLNLMLIFAIRAYR